MSPGDRTYDAIGLMRQLNEQSASQVAEAREVLATGGKLDEVGFDKRCAGSEKLLKGHKSGKDGCVPVLPNNTVIFLIDLLISSQFLCLISCPAYM